MRIVPSFLRWKPQTARGELPSELSPAELALTTAPPVSIGLTSASISGSSPSLNLIAEMLAILNNYLPPPVTSLPKPTVSVTTINERSVGLGHHVGMETRGIFPIITLKGVRLEAVVRFQLWVTNLDAAETAMTDLVAQFMADRDVLRTVGIFKVVLLKIAMETSPSADFIDSLDAWHKMGEFRVLYEFQYEDTDGAESLITRIPIASDLEVTNSLEHETTVVTDEMVRWDNESTPTLSVRGSIRIGSLSVLSFVSAADPSGTVTLTRTFDGATGVPMAHLTLADFLSAITRPSTPENHAKFTFTSLTDFLAAFENNGDSMKLGDWDLDGVADSYQARILNIEPVIRLPRVSDRLEIAYENLSFDQVAVVYLRIKRG